MFTAAAAPAAATTATTDSFLASLEALGMVAKMNKMHSWFGKKNLNILSFFSILLTHEGSNREVYRDFQPSLTSSANGAKGFSDHRFRAPPAYTARLL